QNGAKILTVPKRHRDGSYSCYLADPDGNTIQILYDATISRAPDAPYRNYGAACPLVCWLSVDRTEERVVHAPGQDDRDQRVPDVINRPIRIFFHFRFPGFLGQRDGDGAQKHQASLQKSPRPFHSHFL